MPGKKNTEVRRHKKRNSESFQRYINGVLKTITQEVGISRKGINVVNSIVNDLFERIATEGANLVRYSKKNTLGSKEIESAVKLTLSSELCKHSVVEGKKAVTKFQSR